MLNVFVSLLVCVLILPFHLGVVDAQVTRDLKRIYTPTSMAYTVAPEADARVNSAAPDSNYGTWTTLRVDGGSEAKVYTYLRFNLDEWSDSVQSVQLRLYALTGSVDRPVVRATDNNWLETGVTWNSRPATTSGAVDNQQEPIAAGTWTSFDVTQVVAGTGTYSFLLQTMSADGLDFASRQHPNPALRPQFVITLNDKTTPDGDQVLLAAGDIASCSSTGDEATADLLDEEAGTVITVGDNVYQAGTSWEFANCYDPSWGRHKLRTRPAPGNHEYQTSGAQGYFDYFGLAAGDQTKGYYSYDLGSWHIVVLNSNCKEVGGCGAGSLQEQWLRADLASHPATCTLAYWHHPRWSSGNHGSSAEMQAFWEALYEAGAEVVLSGHDHHYERFAPQDPDGEADAERGIRAFIVGMGGKTLYALPTILPNSEKQNSDTFGILKLTLQSNQYQWRFISEAGKTFTDSGTTSCHQESFAE